MTSQQPLLLRIVDGLLFQLLKSVLKRELLLRHFMKYLPDVLAVGCSHVIDQTELAPHFQEERAATLMVGAVLAALPVPWDYVMVGWPLGLRQEQHAVVIWWNPEIDCRID